jgi:putative transposase
MRFAFIQTRAKEYPVKRMCQMLKVSRSGYYAWRRRPPSARHQQQEKLLEKISAVHEQSRRLYGSPRVHRQLISQGEKVCENTVATLMKARKIRSEIKKRFKVRTTDSNHAHPVAANVLDRQFQQSKPNTAWASDITYIPTDQGWLYLAAVIDLYSRKIVGWAMADHLKSELALGALNMAITRRKPDGELLHHSDRGVQYACNDYRSRLDEKSMVCSMSRSGNCYDNAVMESFFGTLKGELVHQQKYATHEQARSSIFEYIEVYYNRNRIHSSLGYKSPEQFEAGLC